MSKYNCENTESLKVLFECSFLQKRISIDAVCCLKVLVILLNRTSWLGILQMPKKKKMSIRTPYKNERRTLVLILRTEFVFPSKIRQSVSFFWRAEFFVHLFVFILSPQIQSFEDLSFIKESQFQLPSWKRPKALSPVLSIVIKSKVLSSKKNYHKLSSLAQVYHSSFKLSRSLFNLTYWQ